jgi:hypothetical protein
MQGCSRTVALLCFEVKYGPQGWHMPAILDLTFERSKAQRYFKTTALIK